MALMKLVDLSGQIKGELATATKNGMVSGTTGNMHLVVTTESDALKVVVVPLQNGPTNPDGTYGTPTWGPAATEDRSTDYHDPYKPGTVMADTDGVEYVWVQDEGFQAKATQPEPTTPATKPITKATIHGCEVSATWRDRNGASGDAALQVVNPNTALLSFYSPDNIEAVVSIVGPINKRSLIKVGSLTAESFSLTVRKAGEVKSVDQRQDAPLGVVIDGFQDA